MIKKTLPKHRLLLVHYNAHTWAKNHFNITRAWSEKTKLKSGYLELRFSVDRYIIKTVRLTHTILASSVCDIGIQRGTQAHSAADQDQTPQYVASDLPCLPDYPKYRYKPRILFCDIDTQCRPRSGTTERGVWFPLFVRLSTI